MTVIRNINSELFPVISVNNHDSLGKVVAQKIIQWAKQNPKGVMSLPTGNTPSTTVFHLRKFKIEMGKHFPSFQHIKFVQMDEVIPLNVTDPRAFRNVIFRDYICTLGIDHKNTLIIQNNTDPIQYKRVLNEWGGIGFYLGGIGKDGHFAYNFPEHTTANDSVRIIDKLSFRARTQLAGEFDGMSTVKYMKVFTIGPEELKTTPEIIIFASGKSKAKIINETLKSAPNNLEYPISYLTNVTVYADEDALSLTGCNRYINRNDDINKYIADEILLENKQSSDNIMNISKIISASIAKGNGLCKKLKGKTILHISPHHDDVALGLFPFVQNIDANHHIIYATSGYRSVYQNKTKIAKMLVREQEAEIFWKDSKCQLHHLRGLFYDNMRHIGNDIKKLRKLIEKINPDVITVVLDPANASMTHFNTLKLLTSTMFTNKHRDTIKYLAYKNVWSTFHPIECDYIFCYSKESTKDFVNQFESSFKSQVVAEFPKYGPDKTFAAIAVDIQANNSVILKKLTNTYVNDRSIFIKTMPFMKLFKYSM